MARWEKGRALIRESFFLSCLEKATKKLYQWAENGIFAGLLTAYPSDGRARTVHTPAFLRRFLWNGLDTCLAGRVLAALWRFLSNLRSRVCGTFLLSFGVYAAIANVAHMLLTVTDGKYTVPWLSLTVAAVCIGAAFPLIFSRGTLREDISGSQVARLGRSLLGIRTGGGVREVETPRGHSNIAFIIGMFLGALTYFVPAVLFPLGAVGIAAVCVLIRSPELGVVSLFFFMPFLPTMVLVGLTGFIGLCFLLKFLLGKRLLAFEAVDFGALAFAFSLCMGGIFSFSRESLKPMLVFVCFLCAFFLVNSLMRTREWLMRCMWAALLGGAVVSLYGIYQYVFGVTAGGAWIDTEMFEDIAGRVVSTLENPNMLAEYLIMLFPMAFVLLVTGAGKKTRWAGFVLCGLLGVCLILTWSRGGWLGAMFGMFVLLLIWHRRTLYLVFAGVLSIPFLPLILPESIVSRFTSIGNLADTSTNYRMNIWRGTVHMLKDYWFTGVGIGEGAWGSVYPRYALAAIEKAPHAHNLYLQIWVEMGIIGLLVFLAFLILLLQSHFHYYQTLAEHREALTVRLARQLRPSAEKSLPPEAEAEKRTTAARLLAAAPLCGLLGSLVQGFTDYTWYNYRVYLLFWLIAGLSAAFVRVGRAECRDGADADLSPKEEN